MADMASPTDASAGSKIFVGGLDRSVDEGVVRNFFQQFGPVVEVLVMRDPHNHQSRGFGFITFQRDDSANQVLQNRYHDMLGKRVEVKSAVPRGQAPPPSVDLHEAPRVTDMDSQEVDLPKVEVVMVMATAVTMPVRKTMPVPTILGV